MNLPNIHEERGCNKKHENVLEEVTPENFELKNILKIFHGTESAKNKLLEAGSNLGGNRVMHQGREEMLGLQCKLYLRRRTSLFTLLSAFFTKK